LQEQQEEQQEDLLPQLEELPLQQLLQELLLEQVE
jgi:hypothetical protein